MDVIVWVQCSEIPVKITTKSLIPIIQITRITNTETITQFLRFSLSGADPGGTIAPIRGLEKSNITKSKINVSLFTLVL